MIHPFRSLVLLAIVIGCLPRGVLGQVGVAPRQGQALTAPQQPTPRNPPPGPSAQDFLRLLFPPDIEPDDFADTPQTVPRRMAAVASQPATPRIPTVAEVTQMTAHQQRALLRQSLARLDEELDQLSTGASWKTFLQTDALGSALWCRTEPEPDPDTRQLLRAVAERFAQVQQQPQYPAIRGLQGFQAAHAVLPEYATGEVEKSQRPLRASTATLANSLSRLRTGTSWKQHLQIDDLQRLASTKEALQPADAEILQSIAERFDAVERKPEYRSVAAAAGFANSRAAVRQMVAALQKQQASQPVMADKAAGMLRARPDASHLERLVVSLLGDLEHLKHHCAAESRASQDAARATLALVAPGADDQTERARKAQEANEVLRQLKERHEGSVRATQEKLLKVLKGLQSGSTKQLEGQPVYILPLDAAPPDDSSVVEILPLETDNQPQESPQTRSAGDPPQKPKNLSPPMPKESSPPQSRSDQQPSNPQRSKQAPQPR